MEGLGYFDCILTIRNSLENIGRVTLEEYFYSSDSGSGSLDKFRMENLDKLTLSAENCFENFPRSKITEIRNVDVKVSSFNKITGGFRHISTHTSCRRFQVEESSWQATV